MSQKPHPIIVYYCCYYYYHRYYYYNCLLRDIFKPVAKEDWSGKCLAAYQYYNSSPCIQRHSCSYNHSRHLYNFRHFRMVYQHNHRCLYGNLKGQSCLFSILSERIPTQIAKYEKRNLRKSQINQETTPNILLEYKWRYSGTCPLGHLHSWDTNMIWSRKNVHIIFESVTSIEGHTSKQLLVFRGKEHSFLVPKPEFYLHSSIQCSK